MYLTFSSWAVKCELTNKKEVPNRIKAIPTAPLVLNWAPGLVLKLSTSGMEQNQTRSRLKNTDKCKVPKSLAHL